MKQILFLTDVDGTLTDGSGIAPSVIRQAEAFTADGHLLALATGRHRHGIRRLTGQLPVNAPCVILAGAALYDPRSDRCSQFLPLPAETLSALETILREYPEELAIQVYTADGQCNLRLNPFLRQHGIPEEIDRPIAEPAALKGAQILKLGLCCENTALLDQCAARFFGDETRYHWNYSFPIAIEVSSPVASKGAALRRLLNSGVIHPDLIAVAGDSANDLSLFEVADLRFAPETAFDEVKQAADRLIPPPSEGGVAEALKQLMLL